MASHLHRGELMATATVIIEERPTHVKRGSLDIGVFLGIAIASIAVVAGIAVTGVSARYFFQPTGLLIVLGGTLGVMLITTPISGLLLVLRRAFELFSTAAYFSREDLIEEIVSYAKLARFKGLVAVEPNIDKVSNTFLQEALMMAMDTTDRAELRTGLENKVRYCERQTESAARVLEMAGGFTPTIGVLGTVVGLIDILRQFSNLATIASGVGVAFTSTFYGLALANLVLLPAAQRIRARAAEVFDLQELMVEGVLCLFDGGQPRMVRQRLQSFLNETAVEERPVRARTLQSALEAGQ